MRQYSFWGEGWWISVMCNWKGRDKYTDISSFPPLSISKHSLSPWYRWQHSTALWLSDDQLHSVLIRYEDWRHLAPSVMFQTLGVGVKSPISLLYMLSVHRFLNSRCSIIAHQCNGIIKKDSSILEFGPKFKAEKSSGCWVLTHVEGVGAYWQRLPQEA